MHSLIHVYISFTEWLAIDEIEMENLDDFTDEDYLTSSEDELSDDNDLYETMVDLVWSWMKMLRLKK